MNMGWGTCHDSASSTHPRPHGDLPRRSSRRSARAGQRCPSGSTSTTRVLDAEPAAAPRERHRGTGRALGMLSSQRAEPSRTVHHRAELLFVCSDELLNHTRSSSDRRRQHPRDARRQDPHDEPVVQATALPFPPVTFADTVKDATITGPSTRGSRLTLARTTRSPSSR